jgi:hypothetical protein
MVLETLDVKKNDIFVYSLNKFDLNRNFKLINKDASIKYPKPIHFNDVCRYLNDGRPKNIIVYRLLTNLPKMDQTFLKYGFVMNIDGAKEVIYFDPVFALKELEDYSDIGEYPFLRFRIQQVGMLSMLSSFGEAKYHEVYAFDLEANEVRRQNDRVFAEIIFAFDEIHFEEEDVANPVEKDRMIPNRKFVTMTAEDVRSDLIEEDPHANANTIKKLRTMPSRTAELLADNLQRDIRKRQTLEQMPLPRPQLNLEQEPKAVEQPKPVQQPSSPRTTLPPAPVLKSPAPKVDEPKAEAPKPAPPKAGPGPKSKQSFGDFLNKVKKDLDTSQETDESGTPEKPERMPVINIFKTSAHIQDFVVEREKKQVVLKLRKRD